MTRHGMRKPTYALSNITETSNNRDLASKHDIRGTLDPVNERFTAAIIIVELGLCNGVIDIDGGNFQLPITEGLVKVVHASGSLFRDTLDTCAAPISEMSKG